jgi:hypothetical protein
MPVIEDGSANILVYISTLVILGQTALSSGWGYKVKGRILHIHNLSADLSGMILSKLQLLQIDICSHPFLPQSVQRLPHHNF